MYYCSKCWRRPCECFDQLECSCGWRGSAARALSGLSFKYCPKCGEQFAADAIRALKDKP